MSFKPFFQSEARFSHLKETISEQVIALEALSAKSPSSNLTQVVETISKIDLEKYTVGNLIVLVQTEKLLLMSVSFLDSVIHQSDYSLDIFSHLRSVACYPLEIRHGLKLLETKEFMAVLTLWEQLLSAVHTHIQILPRYPQFVERAMEASCRRPKEDGDSNAAHSLMYLLALNYAATMRQGWNSGAVPDIWRSMIMGLIQNWLWEVTYILKTNLSLTSITDATQKLTCMRSFTAAEI